MAATGFTPIITYHSTTPAAVPSNANLAPGELSVNIADMKLYTENSSGTVTLLASADAAAGNFTTVDTTNLEVTNIKAKDGTAAATIADSTGKITVSTELDVDNLNFSGNAIISTNTDGNIDLTPNGTGEVNITKVDIDGGTIDGTTIGGSTAAAGTFTDVTLNAQGDVRFADSDSSNWVAFQAPATIASNITWTLPAADGTSGQVLSTNGSGTLSWASGGGGGSSISAGDSKVEVTDAGTGKVEVTVDNVEVADFTTGAIVFNETGADQDFRVEGDGQPNLFVIDAGVDKVGIGTNTFNTNGARLQVVNGISFPATQSACSDVNTLDDYEEGTWTPTYFGESSAGTTTYSSQLGVYTKIGNLVVASGIVVVDSATGTGNIRIGGFPFTSASNNQCISVVQVSNYNWSAGTFLILEIAQSATTANIYGCADDAANVLQQVTNESQLFRWTCSYRV